MTFVVHKTQKTEPAHWLARLLVPVVHACKFDSPPPIELRPMGGWAGYCQLSSFVPDRRVCLSNRLPFVSLESLVTTYLHESCHRLLEGREVPDHGAEFAALLEILHARAILSTSIKLWFQVGVKLFLSEYDFQDEPNKADALEFANSFSDKYAASEYSAEELATMVILAFEEFSINKLNAAKAVEIVSTENRQLKQVTRQLTEEIGRLQFWILIAFGVGFVELMGLLLWVI